MTCLVFKTTYIDGGKPLREGTFSFTRRTLFPPLNKRNTHDKAKGLCSTSERYVGELGVRCLSTLNRGQYSRQQSHIDLPLIPLLVCPLQQYCFDRRPLLGWKHHSIATHQTTSAILRPSSQDPPKSIVLFQSKTNQILVSLPWTSTKRLGIGLHLSRKSIPIY